MIRRGLCVLAMLSNCVLSLPLAPSQPESEDVKVMKCVVEALADVLSRPRPLPVSQDCLVTLRSDDRLVSILRHRSFLTELQQIALRGEQRAQQDGGQDAPGGTAPSSEADVPDRSMLEALGSPGERSILSEQPKAGNGDAGEDESREDGESRQDDEEKRGSEEHPESPQPVHPEEESSEREDEKRRAENEHKEEPDEDSIKDNKGGGSGEKRSVHRNKEEEEEKRAAQASHKHQEKHEDESHQRWTKRGKSPTVKEETVKPEAAHHSKEEEMEERHTQTSPEQKELQMVARRRHEEKRGSEEEGSASRKPEDHEVESLATIESELESVAQKLHELRRG